MRNLKLKGTQKLDNLSTSREQEKQKCKDFLDKIEAEYSKISKSHLIYIEILSKRFKAERKKLENLNNFTKEKRVEIKQFIEQEESKLS